MERCPKNLTKKGKSHQASAPDVDLVGFPIWVGDIILEIAVTPHFVMFMTYLAMLQHLNVDDYALIAGIVDTPCNFVAN